MNSFYFSTVVAAVVLANSSATGQGGSAIPPKEMLPERAQAQTWLTAKRLAQAGSELQVRRGDLVASLVVPYETITSAAALGADLIVAGVLPGGSGEYRSIARTQAGWTLATVGVAIPDTYPIRVSCTDGLLAMLLADGRVMAATCDGALDLPAWAEFELVGHVNSDLVRMRSLAGFTVLDANRIEVYANPASRRCFERSQSGQWEFVTHPLPVRAAVRIEEPARIGASIRYHCTASGPIFFEEEGGALPGLMIADHASPGTGYLPPELTQTLRADRRYRIRASGAVGAWFHPEAITGSVRHVAALGLQECRIWESGVRAERGAVPFRTTLEVKPGFTADRVRKLAFLAETAEPSPPVVERNGNTWLVPERALLAEKALPAGRKAHVLAVSVPLPADRQTTERWLHFQFVVLATDGAVLGATGVRSVPIMPDRGDRTAAQEEAGRAAATAYWAANQVTAMHELWEQVVNR